MRYFAIQLPLRREPGAQRGRVLAVALLDPGTAADAIDIGVRHPRIFVDLTEQVLAIDQLEAPPATKTPERQPQPSEVLLLGILHIIDDLHLDAVRCRAEALTDSVPGAWARHDEFVLVEVQHGGV